MLSSDIINMLLEGIVDTLRMTLFSTLFAYIIGFPVAVLLVVCRKGGLRPIPILHGVVDAVVNILRSVPFLILVLVVTP